MRIRNREGRGRRGPGREKGGQQHVEEGSAPRACGEDKPDLG